MKYHIINNYDIFKDYKSELVNLNIRLFGEPYFYNLKSYQVPIELNGLINYLSYVEEIVIYSTATFIDFINILLILSFLKNNNYQGKVLINYLLLKKQNIKDAIFTKTIISINDFIDVDLVLANITNNQEVKNHKVNILGYANYINFYNMLLDSNKFLMNIDEMLEEVEEDESKLANYLAMRYSNMGLSEKFYDQYLKEHKIIME